METKIKSLFNDKTVLLLVVYTDNTETAELESHMIHNKLGMIYYTILFLPLDHESLLQNIFTYSIHSVEDEKILNNSVPMLKVTRT